MGTLTIWFSGVCTHFINTVAGVPHRVVLPNASAFQLGLIETPQAPAVVPYFIMPHYAILRVPDPSQQDQLSIPGVMDKGNIFSGVRLQVANSTSPPIEYDPSFCAIPQITQFLPSTDYTVSNDVVIGGQAACYFDIFSGAVMKSSLTAGKAKLVNVTIQTRGRPELMVTRLIAIAGEPSPLWRFELGDDDGAADLLVANFGMDCGAGQGRFDFLLHYLTASEGIPRFLTLSVPGMPSPPVPFTHAQLEAALQQLGEDHFPRTFSPCDTDFHTIVNTSDGVDATPACSDTRYP